MKQIAIFILMTSFLARFQIEAAQKVRGVPPERMSLYDEQKPFACLDGSGNIPFSQVNDDYCDCRDGSDEPGTSACSNSFFACENLGYIVQMIPSSRINDGICDCCDGSDEYTGFNNVQCENKCIALAAKKREEDEKQRVLREQGFLKRKELIDLGNEFKKSLQTKLKELETNKASTQDEKVKLEEKKNEAEKKANEAKEKQDKIFEERKKELEKIELARKARELFEYLDLTQDSFLTPNELLLHQELDILFDNDGQFTIEEATRLLDQNEKIDLVVFHASYYEKISPHISRENKEKKEEAPPTPAEAPQHDEEKLDDLPTTIQPDEHHEEEHDEHSDGEEHVNAEPGDHDLPPPPPPPSPQAQPEDNKYDEETQKLIHLSNEARSEFEKTDQSLRDIDNEIKELNKKLDYDVGPNGEFASMIDKCFEFEDREYIYKLCPFDKTVQRSKTNSHETTIGYWKGWGDDASSKYSFMKFDNGLTCWNGPARSTNVYLACGVENKLLAVSEPNRCEYEMRFETPAICEQNETHENIQERIHEDL